MFKSVKNLLPGSRILIYLVLTISIISINSSTLILYLSLLSLCIILISGNFKILIKRFLITIPFIITAVLISFLNSNNSSTGFILAYKLINIVLLNVLIFTDFNEGSLSRGLKQLHFPSIITSTAFFIISYRSVLIEEIKRLKTARLLRGGSLGQNWFSLKEYLTWSQIIGAALLNSLDRSERVFQAMTIRGLKVNNLSGNQKKLREDWLYIMSSIVIAIIILYINYTSLF